MTDNSPSTNLEQLDDAAPPRRAVPPAFVTAAATVLLLVLVAGHWRSVDSSTALFHLKAGGLIIRTGEVPNRDIFSIASRADSWVYFEWLWAVFAANVYSLGKWSAVSGLTVLLGALTYGMAAIRARKRSGSWLEPIVVTTLAGVTLLPVFQPEAAFAVLPVYVLTLLLAEARSRWPMAMFPALVALWANLHSGVLLAFVTPVAYAVFADRTVSPTTRRRAYLAVIIIAGLLAILINPHSVRIVQGLAHVARVHVTEAPARLAQNFSEMSVILRGVVALLFLVIALATRSLNRRDGFAIVVLFASFLAFGTGALNFLILYLTAPAAQGLAVLLAGNWQIARVRYLAGTTLLAVVLAWAAAVALGTKLTPDAWGSGLRRNVFPETAAGRLAAIPLRAGILNRPNHGGYLIWRLWPNWKVAADGRTTVYDPGFFEQYENVWRGGEGWQAFMALWRVHAVLGDTEITTRYPTRNIYHELAKSDEWTAAYWDRHSILYVKSDIELASTNLTEFRKLKPGLPWPAMAERLQTPSEWQEFRADLRRALLDDPGNSVALEFLRRAEAAR